MLPRLTFQFLLKHYDNCTIRIITIILKHSLWVPQSIFIFLCIVVYFEQYSRWEGGGGVGGVRGLRHHTIWNIERLITSYFHLYLLLNWRDTTKRESQYYVNITFKKAEHAGYWLDKICINFYRYTPVNVYLQTPWGKCGKRVESDKIVKIWVNFPRLCEDNIFNKYSKTPHPEAFSVYDEYQKPVTSPFWGNRMCDLLYVSIKSIAANKFLLQIFFNTVMVKRFL